MDNLLAVGVRVESEVEPLQRLGGVDGRTADAEGQLVLSSPLHLVLEQASQEFDVGRLLLDGLLIADIEAVQDARQSRPLQEGDHLVGHRNDPPPITCPASSSAFRANVIGLDGEAGRLGTTSASRPCPRMRLT